jgi:hypothetical protein
VSDGLRLKFASQPPNIFEETFFGIHGATLPPVTVRQDAWAACGLFAGSGIQIDPKNPRQATSRVCDVISMGLL